MSTVPTDGTVYKASDGNWYRWPDPTPFESEQAAHASALPFAPPPPPPAIPPTLPAAPRSTPDAGWSQPTTATRVSTTFASAHVDQGSWFSRHKILSIVGGLFILLVIGSALADSQKKESPSTTNTLVENPVTAEVTTKAAAPVVPTVRPTRAAPTTAAPAPPPPAAAEFAFGKSVQGSKFLVTVSQVGRCTTGSTACTFEVLYQNNGDENKDEFIISDDLVLIDRQNRKFESEVFESVDLQPGQQKRVRIEFKNLAADFAPQRVEVDTGGASYEINY